MCAVWADGPLFCPLCCGSHQTYIPLQTGFDLTGTIGAYTAFMVSVLVRRAMPKEEREARCSLRV